MKRILIIGDYYPHISFNSVLNKLIAERLNREGYKLILLSIKIEQKRYNKAQKEKKE